VDVEGNLVHAPAGRIYSPDFADQLWGPHSLLFSGYRRFFSGVKWLGHDADHSPLSNAEI